MYSLRIEPNIDQDALLRFMGGGSGARFSHSLLRKLDRFNQELDEILKPRTLFRTLDIRKIDKGGVILQDEVRLKSPKLAKTLTGCDIAVCFLVTSGPVLDQEVARLNQRGDISLAYILDVLGSVAAESMAQELHDYVARLFARQYRAVTHRFSPGYCDWPVTEQKKLFQLIDSQRIGVRLLESCLMQPGKTISGVFGIQGPDRDPAPARYNPCDECGRGDCRERRD